MPGTLGRNLIRVPPFEAGQRSRCLAVKAGWINAGMFVVQGLADRLAASALRLYLLIKGQRRLADVSC